MLEAHPPARAGLVSLAASLRAHRGLVYSLVARDVVGRYRGSLMGLLWSFFNPLLMLAVYTYVFSVVFQARWSTAQNSRSEFALILFAGLMVFNFFGECVNRAPTLIVTNTSFVKKIVFPLEILPVVSLGSAAFHLGINIVVWFLFHLVLRGLPPASAALLPVVLAPLVLMLLGITLVLSSLGVYLRDVAHVVSVGILVLMYLSPIFYPLSVLPEHLQRLAFLSPITLVVEQTRDALIWGRVPDWRLWAASLVVAIGVLAAGFAWFQKTRRGFADVL